MRIYYIFSEVVHQLFFTCRCRTENNRKRSITKQISQQSRPTPVRDVTGHVIRVTSVVARPVDVNVDPVVLLSLPDSRLLRVDGMWDVVSTAKHIIIIIIIMFVYCTHILHWNGTQRSQTSADALSIISVAFASWQHYIRRRVVLSGNGKESFNPILDPDADPDHHQKLTTSKLDRV